MSGFFGVASRDDCVHDLFFGTDYQSHLGTQRGGMAVTRDGAFTRFIHDIRNTQFRSKFEDDVKRLAGNAGVGVISDFEDQRILVSSHLGTFAIVTVGVVQNADALAREGFKRRGTHFSGVAGGGINPTELVPGARPRGTPCRSARSCECTTTAAGRCTCARRARRSCSGASS